MNGINVVLTLLSPDGKKPEEVDTPESTYGEKSIMHVSESAGDYLLEVRAPERNAAAGRYRIEILRRLPATEQNMSFIIADRATAEGWRLHEIGTEESLLEAIGKFKEAIPHWHNVGDRFEEATALMYLGEVHYNLSEYEEALKAYEHALPLWEASADHVGEGWTFNNIGAIYSSWGEKQKAMDSFTKSLHAYQQEPSVGRVRGLGISLTAVGGAYVALGEKQKALNYLNRAVPYWRAVNDTNGEARALFQIAEIQSSVGDYATALKNYLNALQFWRSTSDLIGEGRVLTAIGRLYTRSGEYQKALDYLGEALRVRRSSGDRRGQARTLTDLGVVYSSLGDNKKALDYYSDALPLHRVVRDREGEANTLYQFAHAERDLGHLVEARGKIEQALKIIEQVRTDIADQELRASYFATVRDYYEFYIDLLMRLHRKDPSGGFDGAATQASERARARSMIETLTAAHVDIHAGVDPELVERERSLERKLNASADNQMRLLRGKDTEEQVATLARKIDELTNEYQEVKAQKKESSPRYAALTQPAPLTLKDIQEIVGLDSLLLEYALGDERSFLWAVSQTSIQSFELPRRAEIEAAAVRFYQLLTARNIHQKGETTEQRQKRLAQADEQYPEAALALSRMLLGAVASQLGSKRLIVVTEGALQYVPFAALPVPDLNTETGRSGDGQKERNSANPRVSPSPRLRVDSEPLVVDHEIVNLPSVSTLAVLRREISGRSSAPKAVAVIADPVFADDDLRVRRDARKKRRGYRTKAASETMEDVQRSAIEVGAVDASYRIPRLLFSRAEALDILSLVPAAARKQALDFEASRTTATSPELGQYRIVHFATHALLNNAHPELSGIVLSLVDESAKPQDGFLRLHEIYNLKLPADLVVLSACQSGLGKEIRGEGMIGLTRGFMYAGAPRVVASLWKIDDRATAEFMKRFYEAMLGEKQLRPAAALQAAQIEMWKTGNWSSPYYWAAFVLQGEWR
jgi:CHAT domain-containing protein/Tfp pilus assembly protein PilF